MQKSKLYIIWKHFILPVVTFILAFIVLRYLLYLILKYFGLRTSEFKLVRYELDFFLFYIGIITYFAYRTYKEFKKEH